MDFRWWLHRSRLASPRFASRPRPVQPRAAVNVQYTRGGGGETAKTQWERWQTKKCGRGLLWVKLISWKVLLQMQKGGGWQYAMFYGSHFVGEIFGWFGKGERNYHVITTSAERKSEGYGVEKTRWRKSLLPVSVAALAQVNATLRSPYSQLFLSPIDDAAERVCPRGSRRGGQGEGGFSLFLLT